MKNDKYQALVENVDNDILIKDTVNTALRENTTQAIMFISSRPDYIKSLCADKAHAARYFFMMSFFKKHIGDINESDLIWPLFKLGIFNLKILAPVTFAMTILLYVITCYILGSSAVSLGFIPSDYPFVILLLVLSPLWCLYLFITAQYLVIGSKK